MYPREKPPGKILTEVFFAAEKVRLVKVEVDEKTNRIVSTSNLTILNLWLVWFGPRREDRLCYEVLAMQMVVGIAGLFVRHTMALWVFSVDNRGRGVV